MIDDQRRLNTIRCDDERTMRVPPTVVMEGKSEVTSGEKEGGRRKSRGVESPHPQIRLDTSEWELASLSC